MNRLARIGLLLWAIGLGMFAVALSVVSVNAAVTTDDPVDLALAINAPDHVAVNTNFVANIAYKNVGTAIAPDARVTATLPNGSWLVPQSVLTPRFVKVSAQIDF